MAQEKTEKATSRARRFGKAVGFFRKALLIRFFLLFVLCLLIAFFVSPYFSLNQVRYELGEYTTESIRAPFDFSVVNEAETVRKRGEAVAKTPPLANLDSKLVPDAKERARQAIAPILAVFIEADKIRSVPQEELTKLSKKKREAAINAARDKAEGLIEKQAPELLPAFEQAMSVELAPKGKAQFKKADFIKAFAQSFFTILDNIYKQPLVIDLGRITQLSNADDPADSEKPIPLVIRDAATEKEFTLPDISVLREPQKILDDLPLTIRTLPQGFSKDQRELMVKLVSPQIRPNLILDLEKTLARKKSAAEAVLPISINFHKNQLIIGEGQPVNEQTLLALTYLSEKRMPQNYFTQILGSAILIYLLILLAFWIADLNIDRFIITDRDFLFLAGNFAVTVILFRLWLFITNGIIANQPAIPELALLLLFPIAGSAMLTRFLLNFEIALINAAIVAILAGMLSDLNLLYTTFAFVVGLIAAHAVKNSTRRSEVLRAGLITGAISTIAAGCILLLTAEPTETGHLLILGAALIGGIFASLVVLSITPIIEWIFGYTTSISLLEFANYEHPLLKQIMMATPGTFQHSVSIGTLAEAAAEAVGADALLVRVGALFHDAGKSENPMYFIENQSGVNPHDELDPHQSAQIILNHVTNGVTLVKKHRLGDRITAFVREHHGTGLIKYFLAKAREKNEDVDPNDFRYSGPKPRSKETGILMICDQIEATSRTMKDAGEKEYREMIVRTINRIRAEKQLDECPLALSDIAKIQDALVQILCGIHHQRIKYPEDRPKKSLKLVTKS